MKILFQVLSSLILIIAVLIFGSGVVLILLGGYDIFHALSHIGSAGEEGMVGYIAVGLLKAVDMFLIAIVLFVFSLGLLILFNNKTESALPANLPSWLRIHNFVQLKAILWEAILTTMVISYLAALAERGLSGRPLDLASLVVPAAILLISVSLWFLKKGEH